MNVELTIQSLFDNSPTLFQTREGALQFLFDIIGNGYIWKKGQLVEKTKYVSSKTTQKQLKTELVNGKAFQHKIVRTYKDAFSYLFNEAETKIMSESEAFKNRLDEKYESAFPCYEVDRSSIGCELPDNIKPDWKNAFEEYLQFRKIYFDKENR